MTGSASVGFTGKRNKRSGFLITFEGIEGAGKTTQIRRLAGRCRRNGIAVCITREPGGSPLAEKIRRLILRKDHHRLTASAELLLYLAARAQHVEEVIRPAIFRGITVLCDRYSDATIAYQGEGRGLSMDAIRRTNRFATGGLIPDLTILLDLDPKTALRRVKRRGRSNRLDAEKIEFYRRVRRGYLRLAKSNPARFRVFRADAPPSDVAAAIWSAINGRLNQSGL